MNCTKAVIALHMRYQSENEGEGKGQLQYPFLLAVNST